MVAVFGEQVRDVTMPNVTQVVSHRFASANQAALVKQEYVATRSLCSGQEFSVMNHAEQRQEISKGMIVRVEMKDVSMTRQTQMVVADLKETIHVMVVTMHV